MLFQSIYVICPIFLVALVQLNFSLVYYAMVFLAIRLV